ncbi:MAG TPA: TniQ family protein [Ktedonobacteraceae bacterium]|nr:TniQ family protein [Ktedonobacteraceae bacterium]
MDVEMHTDEHAGMEIPPRSRLYHLPPRSVGTLWIESLTSYINRLAWAYRVSPRVLVAQEIVPQLSSSLQIPSFTQLATFSRSTAMGMNGTGDLAVEWPTILEELTLRSDLHLLTLRSWVGNLPSRGLLRKKPAWCPLCYTEWRKQGLSVYQPLLWMVQMVTMCLQHQIQLEDRCPHCQKYQSIITLKTTPGHCTQCHTWLGKPLDVVVEQKAIHWQEWVLHELEDLRKEYVNAGVLPWEQFFSNLALCLKEWGVCSKLADLTGFSRDVFYLWVGRKNRSYAHNPSLETIFEFCYACNVTPLQVMKTSDILLQVVRDETHLQQRRPSRFTRSRVDQERCREFIQAVLDGREEPLGAYQVARRLGYDTRLLVYHFPQECKLLTQRAQVYRRQRREKREAQVCEEVRQAVIILHEQGIFPTHRKVRTLLSDPNLIRMPKAIATWHAVRHELGYES